MINFNEPLLTGKEKAYLEDLFLKNKYCGDGYFTKTCNKWLENLFDAPKVLLTTSCTHALEMAAILADIKEGDEIITSSFTFVSTVNAFVLRGAKIVFVDIRPDTMNIDENKIEKAITKKTKAIVPVHYGGISCNMKTIMDIAKKYNLLVIEDAAQCLYSFDEEKHIGTRGHLSVLSFHETKNIHCGEGGALVINDSSFIERAEIIREKGTNRSKFIRGQVDKYTWVDIGSSYLPSELNAAFLYAQLEFSENATYKRRHLHALYTHLLQPLITSKKVEIQVIPEKAEHNAHMFYIKLKNIDQRQELINFLKRKDINAVFHYIPLHSSEYGINNSKFSESDIFTTKESERLLRLPMHYFLTDINIEYICNTLLEFNYN